MRDLGDFRVIWECWHFYSGSTCNRVFFSIPNSSHFPCCYICLANNLTHNTLIHVTNTPCEMFYCMLVEFSNSHQNMLQNRVLMYLDTLYRLSYIHVSIVMCTNGVILLIYVSVPPTITVLPVRQSIATVGKNLTLICNASGDPTPNITWTKEGKTAPQFNVSGHKLHLVDVKREDFGSYKCTADNGYGTPATSLAVVNVKCKFYTLIWSLLADKNHRTVYQIQ